MRPIRLSSLFFVATQAFLFLIVTACDYGEPNAISVEESPDFDLAQAASVDPELCNISNMTIGSSLDDVIDSFGITADRFTLMSAGDQPSTKFLEHEGKIAVLIEDVVVAVGSETPAHGIDGSLYPSDSSEDVIRVLGETLVVSGDDIDVLSYWCRDFRPLGNRVMMAITVAGGEVDSISIISSDEE